MADTVMTKEHMRDPEYLPPMAQAIPLGLQHVLAMFASNVTPAFIVAGAAGLAGADLVYMVQMAMVFSGVATLIQTVGIGPVRARLPIVQGTSFAFIPIMIPVAKAAGMGAVLGGGVVIMFGMVASAGLRMIGEVEMNRRNMVILAVSLAIGLGLQAVPVSLQHLPDTLKIPLTSGLLPAAFLAVTLNALLPKELKE